MEYEYYKQQVCCGNNSIVKFQFCIAVMPTVFRQINVPGTEAQSEPLPLTDFNEINYVNSGIP